MRLLTVSSNTLEYAGIDNPTGVIARDVPDLKYSVTVTAAALVLVNLADWYIVFVLAGTV
jgi:hypothetical protein